MENDNPTNGQLQILRLLDGGLSRKLVYCSKMIPIFFQNPRR